MTTKLQLVAHPSVPFVNADHSSNVPVVMGASYRRQAVVKSSSNTNQSCTFSVQPPANTGVDKCLMVRLRIEITEPMSAVVGHLRTTCNNFYLRDHPITRMTTGANLVINGTTFSANLKQNAEMLVRTNNNQQRRRLQSTCSDVIIETSDDTLAELREQNTVNSKFHQNMSGNILDYKVGDVAFVEHAAAVDGKLVIEITESLKMPVLNRSYGKSFGNVTQMDLSLNFDNMLSAFKNKYSAVLSPKTFALTSAELLVNYYSISEKIPEVIRSPYMNTVSFQNTVLQDDTSTTIANYKLNVVPEYVVFYMSEKTDISKNSSASNVCCKPISKVSLTINNQSSLLASSTIEDLYQMSAKNGLDTTTLQGFKSTTMIVLKVGVDILVDDNLIPGSNQLFNLQATLTHEAPADTNTEIHTLFLQPAEIELSENQCNIKLGYPEAQLVSAVSAGFTSASLEEYQQEHEAVVGGGIFGSVFRSVFKPVAAALGNVAVDVVAGAAKGAMGGSGSMPVGGAMHPVGGRRGRF
tara:strand:- start:14624 stop:16195 length:1572 start_codon:yes stop_codon:yes gene_type:complete